MSVPERLRWASLVNGWWDSPVSLLETPLSIWRPQLEQKDITITDITELIAITTNRKYTVTLSPAALTWCREGRWSYGLTAENQVSWGCSPAACADSDWHSALSGSQPCLGTPQAVGWQETTKSLYLLREDRGLVRWLGSGSETCLKTTKGVREKRGVKT